MTIDLMHTDGAGRKLRPQSNTKRRPQRGRKCMLTRMAMPQKGVMPRRSLIPREEVMVPASLPQKKAALRRDAAQKDLEQLVFLKIMAKKITAQKTDMVRKRLMSDSRILPRVNMSRTISPRKGMMRGKNIIRREKTDRILKMI